MDTPMRSQPHEAVWVRFYHAVMRGEWNATAVPATSSSVAIVTWHGDTTPLHNKPIRSNPLAGPCVGIEAAADPCVPS